MMILQRRASFTPTTDADLIAMEKGRSRRMPRFFKFTRKQGSKTTVQTEVSETEHSSSSSEPAIEWSEEDIGPLQSKDQDENDSVQDDLSMGSFTSQSSAQHDDIPPEIIVIKDSTTTTSSSSSCHDMSDVHMRLDEANALAQSYQAKLQSTEKLVDSLNVYLRKTQGYAEDLLSHNASLEDAIQDMERGEVLKNDLFALLKIMMCFALFSYMCGGSDFFLVASVVFYLFAEAACYIV